jgi:hypothetical protein
MTGTKTFQIDSVQWGTDLSTYFLAGQAYWAKVAGAKISLLFLSSEANEVEIKYRVRTGSATNPTEYVSSYKIEVNSVVVPMILDTDKPNEKRPEFGNSYIGYIKGKAKFVEGDNTLDFTATKQFGAVDDWFEVIPPSSYTQAQLDAYAAQKTAGMFTAAEKDAAYAAGFKEGELQGTAKGKRIQFDANLASMKLVP